MQGGEPDSDIQSSKCDNVVAFVPTLEHLEDTQGVRGNLPLVTDLSERKHENVFVFDKQVPPG